MAQSLNIKNLLPLILAFLLPFVGFYSTSEVGADKYNFYARWLTSAVTFYGLWYALKYFSEATFKYKYVWLVIFLLVIFGLMYQVLATFDVGFQIQRPVRIIFALIVIAILQYANKTQVDMAQLRLEKEQIQTENYKTQLKALRTQIDPHFLFNSLNTLRSMVRQQHVNSEEFIVSLSDFYRHTLQHNENTTLPLSDEIAVLESYLFVMKSRNEKAVQINWNIDQSILAYQLPTLALQVVTENCFKHNSMTRRAPLCIEITNDGDTYILVKNNVQPKLSDTTVNGFGLEILKKRYDLMNISNGVWVEKTIDRFIVRLKLIAP